MVGHALASQLARRHERQLDPRMRGHQLDQLGAGVAAGANDAQGEFLVSHECESRRNCRLAFTAGHSESMMENTTVSRRDPSA